MISHKDKCIFIHIPKTAGQSVESVFAKRMGLTWQQRAPLLLRRNNSYHDGPPRLAHLTAREYVKHNYITTDKFNEYFKFSFVRNPWARIVSEFNYRKQHGDINYQFGFKEFLLNRFPNPEDDDYVDAKDYYRHVIPQVDFLFDENGNSLVNFIGKYENLQKDFNTVCEQLSIENQRLPHKNKTGQYLLSQGFRTWVRAKIHRKATKHYCKYYDDETRLFVAKLYQKDIDAFGYDFEKM